MYKYIYIYIYIYICKYYSYKIIISMYRHWMKLLSDTSGI